ncbi:gastrula zinc finger protein XlCGF53.1-like, partial [Xenopus laevis]|uniref:Gastrula zinc finger protein XlCGF53.1-like n=1 Tax=Xenopus laevis TaxID=8355 RepID=A0A8J1LT90_XENLA
SDDGGALHAPGSVIQKENNKNDKKILELMSNIIQLLTGEVAIRTHHFSIYFSLDEWDYIKRNKDLYREGMKEEPQLHPLDCDYEEESDITADPDSAFPYNNSSKIGVEGADCVNGNLSNPEISPAEQPPPADGIKEETASCEEVNQSHCSINPFTEQPQRTDTPTPIMGYSLNNSLAETYISVVIKEEAASWEEGNQSDCSINPLTEQIQGTDTPTPIMGCNLNNSLAETYISVVIKEEAASWEEGNQSDCSINPLTEQIQGTDTPTPVMGYSLNNSLSHNYISNEIKEEVVSWEEGNQSHCWIRPLSEQILRTVFPIIGCNYNNATSSIAINEEEEGNQSDCSINPLTEQIQGTKSHTPIMGCSLNNSLSQNYISDGIKEEVASWEVSNQSDCSINPLTEQIQGTDTPTPIMGCSLASALSESKYGGNNERIFLSTFPLISQTCYCTECHKHFSNRSSLLRHQRTHRGAEPYLKCPECGKGFAKHSQLALHSRTHTREKTFLGNRLKASPDLNKPFRLCKEEIQFTCSKCNQSFHQSCDLDSHLRTHTDNTPYTCSECGTTFRLRSDLMNHFRIHKGVKPFSCSECGKCFKRSSELVIHYRNHTGERPFACTQCGKCFSQRPALNKHHRSHMVKKPFSCSECDKCFIQRSDLNRHQRIHTRQKQFACAECGKCFMNSSSLKTHHRSHKGKREFSCTECGQYFSEVAQLVVHFQGHASKSQFLSV